MFIFSLILHNNCRVGEKMAYKVDEIVAKIKKDTNNNKDIIYREKKIAKTKIAIIFNEPLTSSIKIGNFIFKSLNHIESLNVKKRKLLSSIKNNINNFKYTETAKYEDIAFYLHRGFTLLFIDGKETFLALETKAELNRSITTPTTEVSLRGSKDGFTEEIQINLGLIKKRMKTNNLIETDVYLGEETQIKTVVLGLKKYYDKKLYKKIIAKLKNIKMDGIINGEIIGNLIQKENKSVFPTILTTERPDIVCRRLIEGRIVLMMDNTCYALILPAVLNDFFRSPEDIYSKSINVTFTRILKYTAFFLALLFPALYIAAITYNQEIIPADLLISFAIQHDGVPFPAFFEAFIMMIAFEIIREADLRLPPNVGNSLSIVGALILGEAAVNAGIVSPIMIIVIATTAIASLPFTELELSNGLRTYRILFMLGGASLGIIGVIIVFLFMIINLTTLNSFGTPYLMPFVPFDGSGIKDTVIKLPHKKRFRTSFNTLEKGNRNE